MNLSLTTHLNTSFSTEIPNWALSARIVYMVIIFVLGVPGNFLILFIQAKNATRSSTDWLVMAMACTDMYGAGISAFLYVIMVTFNIYKVSLTSPLCQIHFYTIYVTGITSMVLLTFVAIDRYIKVCWPHSTKMSVNQAKHISIVIVLIVIFCYSPVLFFYKFDVANNTCDEYSGLKLIIQLSSAFFFVLLFIITTYSYTRVAMALRKLKLRDGLSEPGNSSRVIPEASTSELRRKRNNHICMHSSILNVFKSKKIFPNQEEGTLQSLEQKRNDESIRVNGSCKLHSPESNTQGSPAVACTSYTNRHEMKDDSQHAIINGMPQPASRTTTIAPKISNTLINRQKVNATTKIMFLLTVIFILTWVINILAGAASSASTGDGNTQKALYMLHPAYMINFVTNPILYIVLSERFRSKVKLMLRSQS